VLFWLVNDGISLLIEGKMSFDFLIIEKWKVMICRIVRIWKLN